MNIAIINNLFEPFARGGAERIAKLQKIGLENLGHKVIVICTKPSDAKINNTADIFYLQSRFIHLAKVAKIFRLFWHIFDLFNFIKVVQLMKILKKEKINVVISHNLTGLAKISAFFISKKYKHIHVLHDINLLHPSGLMYKNEEKIIDTIFAKLYQRLLKICFNNIDTVISPSKWLLDLYLKKGFFCTANIRTIENPIDVRDYLPEKNRDKINFIFIGLIERHKGIDTLLEAWGYLTAHQKIDNTSLTLVGEIIDSKYLEKIKKIPNIKYLGKLNRKEIENCLLAANCLIAPSICYENSPTVIYEAASFALAVIASDIGGSKELTEKINGLVFETGNSDSLVEKMIEVASDTNKAINDGRRCYSEIKKFSVDKYFEKINEIIT